MILLAAILLQGEAWQEPVLRLPCPDRPMRLRFTPDGRRLFAAISGGDRELALSWEVETGREAFRIEEPKAELRYLTISADGRVGVGIRDRVWLTTWDGKTGRKLMECFPLGTLCYAEVSPDGSVIGVSHPKGGGILLLDASTGKKLRNCPAPRFDDAADVIPIFSPDGRLLAVTLEGCDCAIWDVASGRHLRSIAMGGRSGETACFSPEGVLVVTLSDEGVRLHRVEDGMRVPMDDTEGRQASSVAFSPDGRLWVFLEATRREAVLRERCTGKVVARFPATSRALAFSPGGRTVAVATSAEVQVWNFFPDRRPPFDVGETAALWDALAAPNATEAFRAVGRFSQGGATAVDFLRARLLEPSMAPERLKRHVDELASGEVEVRDAATTALGEAAGDPALWTLLGGATSEELKGRARMIEAAQAEERTTSPTLSRRFRAVWALELLGARAVLEEVARGPAPARQVREAKAALGRMPEKPR